MEVAAQRRIAAKVMKCGESRVWMDPAKIGEVAQAITTADVRRLIGSGIIKELPKIGLSSGRKKYFAAQKKRGRRKNKGSRKGRIGTRFSRKKAWISNIRAQRNSLSELLKTNKITKKDYKHMYRQAKGGYFRSRAHIKLHIEEAAAHAVVAAKERIGKTMGKKKTKTEGML